jgi:hypothetical protein
MKNQLNYIQKASLFVLILSLFAYADVRNVKALPATLYVSTTGNDANDCITNSTPCATINGAIGKAVDGDTIRVASGIYTGSGTDVVRINKNLTISGGWDSGFSSQSGLSTIDGQKVRTGLYVGKFSPGSINMTASIDHFVIKNGYNGGISNNYANLTITNSSIQNNVGTIGGGIKSDIANLTLNNVTISNNSGPGLSTMSGNININNTTISENTAFAGGGIKNSFATVQITNSILSGNIGTSDGPDCYGTLISLGNNIIGNTTDCNITAASGDQFSVNPQLGILLSQQGYYPLVSGSPAINAGNSSTCIVTDQRGLARVGTCDIPRRERHPAFRLLAGMG